MLKVKCTKCNYKWTSLFDNRVPVMCTKCKKRDCIVKDNSIYITDVVKKTEAEKMLLTCPSCNYAYGYFETPEKQEENNLKINFFCEFCDKNWKIIIENSNSKNYIKIIK